jgi:predicted adenine nucleotide alpha hydrolase (AANH) superfamily ATPase
MNLPSSHDAGPRILLHACCGPCTEYPARQLLQEGYEILGYFYNPNIHPSEENRRRRENFQKVAEILRFQYLAESACEPSAWQNWTGDDASRCRMCYARRLSAAAAKARELGIPTMTTTLLVSPWQDHEALREIGSRAAAAAGVTFLDRDFRIGYRLGQQQARADGLYRQRYCGCLPSLEHSQFKAKILHELSGLAE